MGNNHSRSIPKYLQSNEQKKCTKKKSMSSQNSSKKSSNTSNKTVKQSKPVAMIKKQQPERFSDDLTEEETTILVGPNSSSTFKWFKGRRFLSYSKGGLDKNIFPNDQLELDRLRVFNFILKWAFEGMIIAPVHDKLIEGINALNVGCGPGLWTGHDIIDLALDYKNSKFTAVDIADLLPVNYNNSMIEKDSVFNKRNVLDNLDFYQCNILEAGLPFEDNTFDFVKQQLVSASYTIHDWIYVIKEIIRVTKPGGYIQLIEVDYHTYNLGPKGYEWQSTLLEVVREKKHVEPHMASYLCELLSLSGLEEVNNKFVSIPMGSWGLELGELWRKNVEMFIESTSPILSQLVDLSNEEYKNQWTVYLEETLNQKAFSNIYAVYGRKPCHEINFDQIDWTSFTPLSAIL